MIVNTGKDVVGRTLANSLLPHAVVGIGKSAVSATDTQMQFEVARVPTRAASYDPATKTVTYTATIPAEIALSISEIGLVSSESENSIGMLTVFDQTVEEWSGGSWVTTNILVGRTGLNVALGTATTAGQRVVSYELHNTDVLQIAYFGAGGTVEVRLNNTATDYLSYTFTPVAGNNIASTPVSSMVRTGDVSLSSITGITVIHSGSGSVTMDAIKIASPVGDDKLIDRQQLGATYTKVAGMPLDVEIPVVIG